MNGWVNGQPETEIWAWNANAVRWLRLRGGKPGVSRDRGGWCVLLREISAVWQAAATHAFATNHPFPAEVPT